MSAVESAVQAAVVRIGAPAEGYDGRCGGSGGGGRGPGRRTAFWGSGFFIAPGWVLTSAHVVGQGRGAVWRGEQAIGITTAAGQRFTGRLACALPRPSDPERPPSPWGAPDIALVQVTEAALHHRNGRGPDCLWLSDRSALTPADVGLFGYMPDPSGAVYAGGAGMASGGTGGPLMLRGGYLPSGCSGGPVVDLARGSVIGICRARAKDAAESAMATPVTALRAFCDDEPGARDVWYQALCAHDRHHLARYHGPGQSWPRTQVELAGYGQGFTADHRAELYGRFAELPPPASAGQVLEMVNEARREVLRESYELDVHAPRSWREGVGLLYDPHDGHPDGPESGRDMEREAVVLFAAKVYAALSGPGPGLVPAQAAPPAVEQTAPAEHGPAHPVALGALRTWVEGAAVSLRNSLIRQRVPGILEQADPPEEAQAPAAYADVLVEIGPDLYGNHPWWIKLLRADGEITPVRNNEEGVPRGELERDIRAALTLALDRGDIGEHLAAVDFVMPRALFDEPVETWRLRERRPGEPFSPHTLPLGRRRTVALRDRQRRAQEPTPEWRSRWAPVAQGGPLEAVPLCREVPLSGHDAVRRESDDAAYGRLQTAPVHAVPVHCARVGRGRGASALGVALAAGHAVALWRRCDERHTDCAEFHERAAGLLRKIGASGGTKGATGLPELVRELRNRNADPEFSDPDAAWARELVLLYDPPHTTRLPDGPLRAPPLRS